MSQNGLDGRDGEGASAHVWVTKRTWNIFSAAPLEGRRWRAPKPLSGWENSMISTSRFVLRGAVAGAIAVLASHNFGAPAVAQQVAVNAQDAANAEDQTAQEPSPDEERPADAETRQLVPFRTSEAPGTIIVDTGERYLYLVQPEGLAIRYGIGVGRVGFQSSGIERVSQKQEWPDWRVPAEMIGRQPYLPRFMAGGPGNPLGARALYLGHTVFRIHGTNQPETIGHAVSSGCIRLDNADVIDLYDRVQIGAKVLVKQSAHGPGAADAVRADEARNERMSMRRLVKSKTMSPIVAKSEIHAMN
jgi:lipoprotein-anchoring transpeptidase ErfK/SrfK